MVLQQRTCPADSIEYSQGDQHTTKVATTVTPSLATAKTCSDATVAQQDGCMDHAMVTRQDGEKQVTRQYGEKQELTAIYGLKKVQTTLG